MFVKLTLPPRLGAFQVIKEDNFPFSRLFSTYLGQACRLGLSLSLPAEELAGYMEDRLFPGEALPPFPESGTGCTLRLSVPDPDVEEYYAWNKELGTPYKVTSLCLARTTLRLSLRYGTSLPRLGRLIESLEPEEKEEEEHTPAFRVGHAAGGEMEEPPASVLKPPVSGVPEVKESAAQVHAGVSEVKESAAQAREALKRFKALTETGIQAEEKSPEPAMETSRAGEKGAAEAGRAEPDEEVIETNPLLSQFGGM